MEPPWVGRIKVPPNDLGQMTKMATMPVLVKTLQIPSFEGLGGKWIGLLKLGV